MKNLRNLLFLFAAVAILASCSKVSDVTGKVSDANGALEGVTVVALETDGTELKRTTTAADGSYSLTEVKRGGSISFSKTGYVTQTKDVAKEKSQEIDVTLEIADFSSSYFSAANNTVSSSAVFAANSVKPSISDFGTFGEISDSWFTSVAYKGAVDPNGTPWYDGWSFYSNLVAGTTTSDAITIGTIDTITDADIQAATGDTIYWTNDKTYILKGFVFINSGKVLDIQEGTVIQGVAGTGASASALIIARGGKIIAEGTASQPIIFTYAGDRGGSEADLRGQWGGLLLLGKASLNSTPGETQIEGIPTTETRGLYGGNDDTDNSGVLRYVSIRHGGSKIGADNEINGLTLGGVGSGTTIEYVEIIANEDDGVEWFGGTVNAKWLISASCADDGLDYDEGYRGKNQFVIVHQVNDDADRGGEHDGGTSPETATPYATPWFVNVTSVGNPRSRAITFRDNAGGYYFNSIFTDYKKGVDIEDLTGQDEDSFKRFTEGLLKLEGNIFYNIDGGAATESTIFTVSTN